jgi:benzoyl-CoA reductase/2-hydroxyglutaryl-CoA dehydratase subunit BcrC/BadD/HgdB
MEGQEVMWKDLGIDLERHDMLMQALGKIYGDVYLHQGNRPKGMEYLDFVVSEVHGLRIRELLDHKKAGGYVAGTFCVYVPDELITATNGLSVGLCGGAQFTVPDGEEVLPQALCPLIKSAMGFKLARICPYFEAADFLIGETTCDGKKKTWELFNAGIKETYIVDLPQKKSEAGRRLWHEEIADLAEFLEEKSGVKMTARSLKERIEAHNRKRLAIKRVYETRKANPVPISGKDALLVSQVAFYDDTERFTAKMNELAEELEKRVADGVGVFPEDSPRIMISGTPMAVPNWKLHDLLEKGGAAVVVEETCTGTRYFDHPVIETKASDRDGVIDEIADRYLDINCACFTPNDERADQIVQLAKDYRADGVVYYVLQFCHDYNIEYRKIEKRLKAEGIPVTKIETDYGTEDAGQLSTRLEAFIEQIKQKK